MICRMDVDIFFGILIFGQKQGYCMGYRLCMITDFQNAISSQIFRVKSCFLHRTTVNDF